MVFIREDEQLRFNASQSGCIESSHSLVCVDAIVLLSMNAEDGGVPFVNEFMWGVLVSLTGILAQILIPVGIFILPVREPHLFRVCVH